eukprot:Tamp_13165.p1 GENE.Tamp_13165~~Tamp_13165.p1  ORF type:complete len:532 (+),score=127.48 Tamp_13165:89-1684(+)
MNIGDHEPVFPDRQRTRTVRYRTEDQLQNLRIKVILQAADLDDNDLPWVRKERVFSWQEKVFGPREFDKYKKLKEGPPPDEARRGSFHLGGKREVSKLDKKYTDAMDHVAQGEIIFSYVDVDPFEDEEEYDESVTTAQDEKPTSLAKRMQNTEQGRGKYSKDGLGRDVSRPFQVMYLVAHLKGRRDPTNHSNFLQEEIVLCRIRAYKDDGLVDMTPGFSPKAPIKVDIMRNSAYTQEELGTAYSITMKGCSTTYMFWILNDTEPADQATKAKLYNNQLKFQQELLDKTLEMRRNLMGDGFEDFSETPDQDVLKCLLNLEIMSAHDFDLDLLYVQYLLDVPDGWLVGDPKGTDAKLEGSTVQAITRFEKEDGSTTLRAVAHFGHPVEVVLWKRLNKANDDYVPPSAASTPTLLIQVNSYDRWDRQRVQGYGNLPLECERTSHSVCKVETWVPTATQIGAMRTFFIGGSAELKDLSFAGVPPQTDKVMSRYGFATETSGFVSVRVNTLVQGPKPAAAATTPTAVGAALPPPKK